eukprot:COSAG01_NODE_48004_length_385_cov_0.580420_1_plen_41_part_10
MDGCLLRWSAACSGIVALDGAVAQFTGEYVRGDMLEAREQV